MKVKFLIDTPEADLPGTVFAFFPETDYNTNHPGLCSCYAHVGQHSSCHIDYANECEKATPEQYGDLLAELVSIGYKDLEILNQS